MAIVYLHIGLPKTGTTAVQALLWDNREILEEHGICYPDFEFHYPSVPLSRNAHFLISDPMEKSNKRDRCPDPARYDTALERLVECGKHFDRIFLTDESIWRYWGSQPERWKSFKSDLEQKGLQLRIIVYLRRQDSLILSIYRQRIKGCFTSESFYDFKDTLEAHYPFDFYAYMEMLSECIGKENLIIRVYEKGQYRGEEKNLFSDFLDIFGLSMQDGFRVEQEIRNLSLNDSLLELRRTLNLLPKSWRDDPLFRKEISFLTYNVSETNKTNTSFFPPGEQSAYLASFAESNSRLAKEYLGRPDGILFQDDSGTELPLYEVDADALLHDTILFYAVIIQQLQQENDKLRKEWRNVRENVVLYRLKRKIKSLLGRG